VQPTGRPRDDPNLAVLASQHIDPIEWAATPAITIVTLAPELLGPAAMTRELDDDRAHADTDPPSMAATAAITVGNVPRICPRRPNAAKALPSCRMLPMRSQLLP
jgi:hypothetical protein